MADVLEAVTMTCGECLAVRVVVSMTHQLNAEWLLVQVLSDGSEACQHRWSDYSSEG